MLLAVFFTRYTITSMFLSASCVGSDKPFKLRRHGQKDYLLQRETERDQQQRCKQYYDLL